MKKSLQSTDGDIAERNEHARKIFRYISEVARRLDEANGACKTISDLFKTPVEINRQKLRENCEKLMFADPVLYGHKAQEILWRKGYYEVVTTAKQFHPNDRLNNSLLAHIEAGIGHYQQIIYKMQMECNINMKGFVDYPILDIELKNGTSADVIDDDLCARSKKAIQKCLIYIGDLCRYKAELETEWDPTYSARYYLQAACINRDIGMPYNQLGTLFIGKNYNLDSVCYYLHCLNCPVPFEGVEDNLVGLLDKNNKMLEDLSLSHSSDDSPASERVKLFIARFLSLLDFWYFQKDPQSLGELSNITLFAFKDCLQLKLVTLSEDQITDDVSLNKIILDNELNPHYISPNIVLNVTSTCLLCLTKLIESDDKSLFPIKAFTLAFFSQLLEHLLRDLEDIGFIVPILNRSNGFIKKKTEFGPHKKGTTKDLHPKDMNDDNSKHENHEVSNGTDLRDLTEKVHKRSSKVRLRRRKHRSSNSMVDSAEESCSDLSELEINDSGDDISLEGESSSDEYCSEVEGVKAAIKVESKEIIEKTNEKPENKIDVVESIDICCDKLNAKAVTIDEAKLNHFLSNNILPSMLLLQAFLQNESDLIKSSGKSGHILFKTLVDILNILNVNFLGRHTAAVERQAHPILDEFQMEIEPIRQQYNIIPLPEDVKLRNIDILKLHQDTLKWDILEYFKPSTIQENAIRIMRLSDFGNFITSLIPGVCYNRSQHFFFVKYKFLPKKPNQKINGKKTYEKKELKRQNQKTQTKIGVHPLTIHNRIHHTTAHSKANSDTSQMRILGKLWLMNQVRELETQVKSGKKSHNFPPYVVVDTDALCLHIKIIKQLVGARKFIVLIPTVVLQAIDELKKESSGARDAIRWLEAQLRSGSRFLRAQRSTEVAPLTRIKYPKRLSKDMQNFVHIIEFCNHFIMKDSSATNNVGAWSGNGDSENTGDAQDCLAAEAKSEEKNKEQNGDSQPTNIIVLLTGSKQYLNSVDQNKDFSFTGLAQTAGVTMEFIQDFSLKWRHIFFKNVKKR